MSLNVRSYTASLLLLPLLAACDDGLDGSGVEGEQAPPPFTETITLDDEDGQEIGVLTVSAEDEAALSAFVEGVRVVENDGRPGLEFHPVEDPTGAEGPSADRSVTCRYSTFDDYIQVSNPAAATCAVAGTWIKNYVSTIAYEIQAPGVTVTHGASGSAAMQYVWTWHGCEAPLVSSHN